MTVYELKSLPKLTYIHRIYMVLANLNCLWVQKVNQATFGRKTPKITLSLSQQIYGEGNTSSKCVDLGSKSVGLARTLFIRCIYGIFNREFTR